MVPRFHIGRGKAGHGLKPGFLFRTKAKAIFCIKPFSDLCDGHKCGREIWTGQEEYKKIRLKLHLINLTNSTLLI